MTMSITRYYRDWLRYRRELADIARLDVRLLRDVGITEDELFRRYRSFEAWRRTPGERPAPAPAAAGVGPSCGVAAERRCLT